MSNERSAYAVRLAEAAMSTSYEDLPTEVIDKAKLCILDSVGVMTAAAGQRSSAVLLAYLTQAEASSSGASVFGFGTQLPLQQAVVANASMLHSLELEDHHSHQRSLNHPGVTSIPTGLAAAEIDKLDGRRLVLGVALGYEIGSRIGLAGNEVGWLNFKRGFHESSVCGPFSAATVLGSLRGTTSGELAQAYGICGGLAAGSMEFKSDGAWSKRLQVGVAAGNGVMALELARAGYTGPLSVFEGKHGFYNSYMLPDTYDAARLLEGYGEHWELPWIQFKPFGCAGTLHSAVTAAVEMREKHQVKPEDVDRVVIHTSSKLIEEYGEPLAEKVRPVTEVDAQFSLPYCVAVALCTGRALLQEFEEPIIRDPAVLKVSASVSYAVDPEIDAEWPAKDATKLEVFLRDGTRLLVEVPFAKGDLGWPVSKEEVLEKFHALTEEYLSLDVREELIDTCEKLEDVTDAGVIPRLCRAVKAAV